MQTITPRHEISSCALALLPRSRNRSLNDTPYRDKLAAYATENVLAQTLCAAFYQNNPNVAQYVASNPSMGLGVCPSNRSAKLLVGKFSRISGYGEDLS